MHCVTLNLIQGPQPFNESAGASWIPGQVWDDV